ncbi:sel1 repeat family protein [Burkholderia cenocepacia]|nr:sel1 repeat family protein [Burkholderia cenocepacia]
MAVVIERQRVSSEKLHGMLASNPARAARWIEHAAKSGLVPAQIVWGQLLLKGHSAVKPNPSAAFRMFKAASTSGNAEALNMVGRCYEQGWGVDVDARQAIAFFEAAAAAGHTWGKVNLAQMLMRAGNPADRRRCFALFKAAAGSGTHKANIKAMNSLARFLEEGWAGQPDPAGAVFWYGKAANLGDHWAQFNLATILLRHGDAHAADKWLQHAIAISDNGFRRRIATLLLSRPEPMLRQRGVDALARCAGGGEPEDLYAYARALDEGVTGHRDSQTATAFFKLAASKGHPLAAAHLHQSGKARRWLLSVFPARARREHNMKF